MGEGSPFPGNRQSFLQAKLEGVTAFAVVHHVQRYEQRVPETAHARFQVIMLCALQAFLQRYAGQVEAAGDIFTQAVIVLRAGARAVDLVFGGCQSIIVFAFLSER